MKITAIITAAGNSARFGGNKLFEKIDGKFVIQKTLDAFLSHPKIDEIVITYSQNSNRDFKTLNTQSKFVIFVPGGQTRTQSIKNALKAIKNCDVVLIHDGARPYVTEKIISDCIQCVTENKSAVCSIPVTDTIAEVKNNEITKSIERDILYLIQTPQGFYFSDIFKAYESLNENENYTDDSQVYQKLFGKAHIYIGTPDNIKITYKGSIKKL
ncbi:MAG: 2-C-methyl-D-erythritol 4-phosphate cytidylyltransferase [Firmicutes bacterium]|nr:2-C-methyl-D-erythritol 4-phosphate cytidylyltransferase [Bacillota bacterium]